MAGIRCEAKRGTISVSPAQWRVVEAALHSHDPKRIAPFISGRGLLETTMIRNMLPGRRLYVSQRLASKAKFLKDVADTVIYDEVTFGRHPDAVYVGLWVSLTPSVRVEGNSRFFTPARSFRKRADVWVSKNDDGEGRVRFMCEDGWLKIKEIKSYVPNDPGP